jgi:hypothetical protein
VLLHPAGDTRPCGQLVEVGRGATLLIHEATFEDGMADEAIAKYHSTTTEALASGAEYVPAHRCLNPKITSRPRRQ